MAEQNPQAPNFPFKDMPRMGRRNALLPDDDGSASPLNLITHSLASLMGSHDEKPQTKLNEGAISEKTEESGPKLNEVATALEKKSESEKAEAEKIVPDEEQKTGAPSSVLKKTRVKLDSLKEDGKPVSTVIPWKQQDGKQTTIVEEKRKIFESFEKTSADPPDTPQMSESKLKKTASKVKTRKGYDFLHPQFSFSVILQKSNTKKQGPYASVSAKVNTRWSKSKIGSLDDWKQLRRPVGVYPSAMSSGANRIKKVVVRNKSAPVVSRPLAGGNSKRRFQDKFPLTIPPDRFKSQNNISAQARAQIISDVTKRLYNNGQTPIQKFRTEILHQQRQMELLAPPSTNVYKSTLFNLHRINNTGILGHRQQQQGIASQTANPTHSVMGHNPQPTAITVRKQVPAPPVQTIQAPPSPFLTSNVSVPNQLMEIPINGEVMKAVTKRKSAGGPVTNVNPSKSKKNVGKSAVVQNVAKGKAAPAANKYNKIYIGPYSGSDSEGEQPKAAKQTPPPSQPHPEQSAKTKTLKK